MRCALALLSAPPRRGAPAGPSIGGRAPAGAAPSGLALVALVALALLLAGCSARDHANPLDPANAQTAGRPADFAAIALSQQVVLSWAASPGLSVQLFRKTDADPDFVQLTGVLPPDRVVYDDLGTTNGVTYHYRLYFVTTRGLTGPPATADATPSRVVAWTADADLGAVVRLSADGREVASEDPGFGEPTAIAIDRVKDLLWVTDFNAGRVTIYNESIGSRVSLFGFAAPDIITLDPADGSAWISDFEGDAIQHFLPSGQPGTPSTIPNLNGPLGVDFDPRSRILWVCEKLGGRMLQFDATGTVLGAVSVFAPSRVAADTVTGDAWVTSFDGGSVYHLAANRTIVHTFGTVRGPIGVAVDPGRGRIWVADAVAGQVIAYRRDDTEEFRVGGLGGARELAVEPLSGEAWVAMNGAIARISPSGTVLTTSRGLSTPVGVGLDLVAP